MISIMKAFNSSAVEEGKKCSKKGAVVGCSAPAMMGEGFKVCWQLNGIYSLINSFLFPEKKFTLISLITGSRIWICALMKK